MSTLFHLLLDTYMMLVRLLIIHRQLNFLVRIKQTLEQLGGFEVSSFTSPESAFEYLRGKHHDIALVDFQLPGIAGLDIVLHLRSIQPDIAIIASPDLPEVTAISQQMGLDGVIHTPCLARDLIPVIRRVLDQPEEDLPDTAELTSGSDSDTLIIQPPPPGIPTDKPDFSTLDSVLVRVGGMDEVGSETLDVDMSDAEYDTSEWAARTIEFVLRGQIAELKEQELNEQSIELFKQLAQEEPPMPTLEETGTVHDLQLVMSSANLGHIADVLKEERYYLLPPAVDEIETDNIPAQVVLRTTLDDSSSLTDSLEELLQHLATQFPETADNVRPLPSWVRDLNRFVREPDFLDELPTLDTPDSSYQVTDMSNPDDIVTDLNNLETEKLYDPNLYNNRPATLPEMPNTSEHDILPPYEFDELTQEEQLHPFERKAPVPTNETRLPTPIENNDDARIAQLALSLTQASLELTADAVLLTHDNQIVAYTGEIPIEEVQEIQTAISNDWDASENETRIRFITLPSSGQGCMLYSRLTDDGLTLTMLFSSNMRLQVIRRQSERLLNALRQVPEPSDDKPSLIDELQQRELLQLEAEAAREVESALQLTSEMGIEADKLIDIPQLPASFEFVGPLRAYTFVWMVRDEHTLITERVAHILARELEKQLTDLGWRVENLQIYEDYVYLLAEVPSETPTHQILADLKQRSGWIAYYIDKKYDPETMWADGYCALVPGRELEIDEIQRFINFARQ
ncbi:MAG: response regulator [Chloroflexi bacterium]|nr:MAG: response regulator [Chloroflexota bacterium]